MILVTHFNLKHKLRNHYLPYQRHHICRSAKLTKLLDENAFIQLLNELYVIANL